MGEADLINMPGTVRLPPPPARATPLHVNFEHALLQHRRLFADMGSLRPLICEAAVLLANALNRGGRLLLCGNRGAGANSRYLAALLNTILAEDPAAPVALALGSEGPATADEVEQGFARQLFALGGKRDCLIVLSTTGESANVLRVMQSARIRGVACVALLGCGGGRASRLADLALVVPHHDTQRIHEAHLFIGHIWCSQFEDARRLLDRGG